MTNEQVQMWIAIGADLGLRFDELGHPYQTGSARDIDGSSYQGAFDWRPLENDDDAFRLMLHYKISLIQGRDGMCVHTPIAELMVGFEDYSDHADKAATARCIIFRAAYLLVVHKGVVDMREHGNGPWD